MPPLTLALKFAIFAFLVCKLELGLFQQVLLHLFEFDLYNILSILFLFLLVLIYSIPSFSANLFTVLSSSFSFVFILSIKHIPSSSSFSYNDSRLFLYSNDAATSSFDTFKQFCYFFYTYIFCPVFRIPLLFLLPFAKLTLICLDTFIMPSSLKNLFISPMIYDTAYVDNATLYEKSNFCTDFINPIAPI